MNNRTSSDGTFTSDYLKEIAVLRWFLAAALILVAAPAFAQRAGDLVAAQPVAAAEAMQAWQIRYLTTDDRGRLTEVTGMVVAPDDGGTNDTPRPIIAWTHGTWGVAQQCAPSQSAQFFALTPAVDAVRTGYVIVAPDYPGLGSNGPHPYLVGSVTARATLDAVRAAQQIRAAGAGNRFAVWGESQGGHAALWTGQLARTDDAGLELVAVAAGAPPTDLAANLRQAGDPNARAFLTALTTVSWSQYYNVPLKLGRRSTPAIMQKLASNCISVSSTPKLGALLGILTLRRDLKNVDLGKQAPWSGFVAANSTAPMQTVPVLIAQTQNDPLVAAAVTRKFAQRLCANRVRVRWIDLPGKDHATTARQSAVETLRWIDDRFAGERVPSDCGKI
jgi:acetyl esterase/lipase